MSGTMADRTQILGRSPLRLYVAAAALIVSAIAATLIWLGPLPPHLVVMSTGAPGSDYSVLAARYRVILKRSGVELRLVPSAGGVENLRRLNDPKSGVSVSFAQGGLTTEAQSPNLASLGTMFFEPFWFFSRVEAGPRLEGLRGKPLSIGPEGSGTRALTQQIMTLNHIPPDFAEFLALSDQQAGEALLSGQIDAATLVTSWDSPVVRQLLASSDVSVVGFQRPDAYVALNPYLTKLRLPAGVGNMATNRPPVDVDLVAPKVSLIVRRDLHPAIQYLLLEAAAEIHSSPDIFQQFGRFPAAERGDLPLSEHAQQFYKAGIPFLQHHLPFWLAVFASRLLVVLIPLIALVYPVLSLAPQLYLWYVRRRIHRLYGELRLIEYELESRGGAATGDSLAQLQQWDGRAKQLRIPVEFVPALYSLRMHIALTRNQLARRTSPPD